MSDEYGDGGGFRVLRKIFGVKVYLFKRRQYAVFRLIGMDSYNAIYYLLHSPNNKNLANKNSGWA